MRLAGSHWRTTERSVRRISHSPLRLPVPICPEGHAIARRSDTAQIRRFRKDRDLTLSELAVEAGVAKSYLSALESDEGNTQRRPSAETLYRLANALGVAVSDLLGRPIEQTDVAHIPESLRDFAAAAGIPRADVDMLASIKFRGDQPETVERWEYIYRAIKLSKPMDGSPG